LFTGFVKIFQTGDLKMSCAAVKVDVEVDEEVCEDIKNSMILIGQIEEKKQMNYNVKKVNFILKN
jgi:hypothetical protein